MLMTIQRGPVHCRLLAPRAEIVCSRSEQSTLRRAACAARIIALTLMVTASASAADEPWSHLTVPGSWNEIAADRLGDYDGYAWYRCQVTVPKSWQGRTLELLVSAVGDVHEVYLNGQRVGGSGAFPPKFADGSAENPRHVVPESAVRFGNDNLLAIRVYDHQGDGGFLGQAPVLIAGKQGISLDGQWEFRTGDDRSWNTGPIALQSTAIFWRVMDVEDALKLAQRSGSLDPKDALATFTVPEDLRLDQVLAEPVVRQPVFLTFDERGRMWVMQYLQYPYPAGLTMLSKDKHWRAVYDKVPEPPPHGVRGADKITIHEDTDGDGRFDTHKTFVDGLNIASSCLVGRGGVWVLNPPYLLFYADKNRDDVPDGNPEVHLTGFGIEDTHSVVNSLTWGPDGWIYATQGSTVSGNVRKPGEKNGRYSMGQLVWRYHPEQRQYEIFAEGGGNAFGVEIDAQGRTFSGHNGGNTRGFHYVQGAYYQKGFSKHGPLSNPYAFGYFPQIKHHDVPRFTHNFVIYESNVLPEAYRGRLFGIEPMQGRVVMSDIAALGSTFQTKDLGHPVTTTDRQFRPVDIKIGPDGAIYFADFCEPQISHREHFSGQIDKSTGRIYRLTSRDAKPPATFDLAAQSTTELIELLKHPNEWHRREALRVIGDRQDASAVPLLIRLIAQSDGQFALECLWALHQTAGLDEETALGTLGHDDPFVRLWTVRLLCDDREVGGAVAKRLVELAAEESYVEVRSQLACSAKRLPADTALPIVAALLTHDEDAADSHLPLLLWWAIESKAETDRDAVLALLIDESQWSRPLVRDHLLHRLMQRYAQAGTRRDLLTCAKLFALAPNRAGSDRLLKGFEAAFAGRSLSGLPRELSEAITKAGGGSLALNVRLGNDDAVTTALQAVADPKTPTKDRIELIRTFGEVDQPQCVPVMLDLLAKSKDEAVQQAVLTALPRYDEARIGREVLAKYPAFGENVRPAAQALLASREAWSLALLQTVADGTIPAESVAPDFVRRMTLHRDPQVARFVKQLWPDLEGASSEAMAAQVAQWSSVLRDASGDPYNGKKLYNTNCGKCHLLFGEGGRIGPDLTTYNRDDTFRMLLNVINPSAEIREGFESYLLLTDDGRTASGFLFDQDNRIISLRGVDGQTVTVERDRVEELIKQPKSLMPEGLLNTLTAEQVRDLFAYLRSAQPLNN